jgi:DNA-binding IclR family transcriptional regulator
MKEYRLSAWPDLDAMHERMAYRRMLSDMSQRHVTLAQLRVRSGLPRHEVMEFITMLAERGLVAERDAVRMFMPVSLAPLGDWLRRTLRQKTSTRQA